ncbi:MAG: DegT/DnrJ/EryC1/StrS family aminotransferase [Bacteroidales bacterium]|nr:DegT/DnrJ/EryC1/StrS family aminotransferase [Bacteroidales bacterium]
MMDIKMVDLKGQYDKIKEEINAGIQEVIDSTAFINGPKVQEFSNNLSKYIGGVNVVPCANGTDALQIALMALGLQSGDEVILPVHTYAATAEVIALLRLEPVFVDVHPEYFTIDVSLIEEKISAKTKAIVPVHLYGQCADMEAIMRIASKHNLYVIEDTAQAIGAIYTFSNGKTAMAGTIGDVGTSSFFPSKNLGCYGDGGAIFVNDADLAKKCKMIANHGQSIKYHHDIIGCNSRLDTLQAAILDVKLKYLDNYTAARQNAAKIYNELLKDVSGIKTPKVSGNSTHVYHQYTLVLEESVDRNSLQSFLKEKGIPTMIYYPVPLHKQKAYIKEDTEEQHFPVTEILSKSVLSLPIHTEINREEQEFVVSSIIEFLN